MTLVSMYTDTPTRSDTYVHPYIHIDRKRTMTSRCLAVLLLAGIGAIVARGKGEDARDLDYDAMSTNSTNTLDDDDDVSPFTILVCIGCGSVATTWTGLPEEHCPENSITLNHTLQESVACGPFSANVTEVKAASCKPNDDCHMSHLIVNDSTIDLERIHCHHQVLPFITDREEIKSLRLMSFCPTYSSVDDAMQQISFVWMREENEEDFSVCISGQSGRVWNQLTEEVHCGNDEVYDFNKCKLTIPVEPYSTVEEYTLQVLSNRHPPYNRESNKIVFGVKNIFLSVDFEVNYPTFAVTCSLRQNWTRNNAAMCEVEIFKSDSRMGGPDIKVNKTIASNERSVVITHSFPEDFEIGSTFYYTVSAIQLSEALSPPCVHVSGEEVVRKACKDIGKQIDPNVSVSCPLYCDPKTHSARVCNESGSWEDICGGTANTNISLLLLASWILLISKLI